MINSKYTNDSSINLTDEKFYHAIVMKKSHHAKIPKVLNIKKHISLKYSSKENTDSKDE